MVLHLLENVNQKGKKLCILFNYHELFNILLIRYFCFGCSSHDGRCDECHQKAEVIKAFLSRRKIKSSISPTTDKEEATPEKGNENSSPIG